MILHSTTLALPFRSILLLHISGHLKVGEAVRCVTSSDSNQFLVPGHTECKGEGPQLGPLSSSF
jgi:hypothetical protein